jgi:hypothetical protein
MPMSDELREVAGEALEAARVDVVRRLGRHGLPTSVDDQRLLVVDNDDLTGWRSEWEAVRRSSLTVPAVLTAVPATGRSSFARSAFASSWSPSPGP